MRTDRVLSPKQFEGQAHGRPGDALASASASGSSAGPIAALRLALLANGYEPIPVAGKRPVLKAWQRLTITPERINAWGELRDAANTGVRCGVLRGADIDVQDCELVEELAGLAERILGRNPLRRIGRPPKLLIPYRAAEPGKKASTGEYKLPDGTRAQVEILGSGQQFVGYGVHPDTGTDYEWRGGGLDIVRLDDLPEVTLDSVARFVAAADDLLARAATPARPAAARADRAATPARPAAAPTADWPPATRELVEDALRHLPNTHDWAGWFRIGAAIWHALGDGGFDLFDRWSSRSPKYDPAETRAKWDSFRTSPPTEVTAATLFYEARQAGWKPARRTPTPRRVTADASTPRAAADASTPRAAADASTPRAAADASTPREQFPEGLLGKLPDVISEDAVGLLFETQHAGHLRFAEELGAWLRWTGSHWARAPKGLAFTFARSLIRRLNRDALDRVKVSTGRAAFCAGVETFARRGPLAIQEEALDRDRMLLATPTGTVDLRTGELREPEPTDYMTMCTAVGPATPGTPAPTWMRFLEEATGNDHELIAFLQRWAGYCLTGETIEHALVFCYGPGGNGKSVFTNTIAGILGSYATVAPMDTFTAQVGDRHPTDLAGLRGARLATASETEEGRAWAESRIKQMTGGEPITARFMRQDFFTYVPNFKLLLIGNHKPVLRNVDEAARRRFRIVPFIRKPANPDPRLADKLRDEWSAILRWAIDGCLAWQREGLRVPQVVKSTSDQYFEQQDTFGAWAAERCVFAGHLQERPGVLLSDFNSWAERNGERPSNRNRLREWFERQAGLSYKRVRGSDYVCGIGLRPPEHGFRGTRDD
jgi:P4 family phage/plasmid primase-like protien